MKQLIIILTLFYSFSYGQGRPARPDAEKIKAIKIGVITEKVKLTESQAEKFWPLYNIYSDERAENMRAIRQKINRNNTTEFSDSDALKRQDDILELREKDIQIERKYRDKFLKIISPKQYSDLIEAEHDFNKMLIDKLKERRRN